MEFGGSDIGRCFHWLLQAVGFPYKSCDITRRMDALLLRDLKEAHCHLNQVCVRQMNCRSFLSLVWRTPFLMQWNNFQFQDLLGVQEEHIQIKHPGQNIIKYTVHMGDERILAPLSVFYPDMLGLEGRHLCKVQERYKSDPGDPQDEDYLIQTMSRHEQVGFIYYRNPKYHTCIELHWTSAHLHTDYQHGALKSRIRNLHAS